MKLWRARRVEHLEIRGEKWVKDGKLMVRKESIPISPNDPRKEAKRAGLVQVWHHSGC